MNRKSKDAPSSLVGRDVFSDYESGSGIMAMLLNSEGSHGRPLIDVLAHIVDALDRVAILDIDVFLESL